LYATILLFVAVRNHNLAVIETVMCRHAVACLPGCSDVESYDSASSTCG